MQEFLTSFQFHQPERGGGRPANHQHQLWVFHGSNAWDGNDSGSFPCVSLDVEYYNIPYDPFKQQHLLCSRGTNQLFLLFHQPWRFEAQGGFDSSV